MVFPRSSFLGMSNAVLSHQSCSFPSASRLQADRFDIDQELPPPPPPVPQQPPHLNPTSSPEALKYPVITAPLPLIEYASPGPPFHAYNSGFSRSEPDLRRFVQRASFMSMTPRLYVFALILFSTPMISQLILYVDLNEGEKTLVDPCRHTDNEL